MNMKRSSQDRMVAGICGGLAHELDWPVTRTRIAYVLVSIFSAAFPGILIYLLLWFVMPKSREW